MCGRFTVRTPTKDIVKQFDLVDAPDLKPHFNIAPTQQMAAIKLDPETGTRQLSTLRWGLDLSSRSPRGKSAIGVHAPRTITPFCGDSECD